MKCFEGLFACLLFVCFILISLMNGQNRPPGDSSIYRGSRNKRGAGTVAKELGQSQRMVAGWESGDKSIQSQANELTQEVKALIL